MGTIIGITGGIGCGKSTVLDYLEAEHHAFILKADEVAHEVMDPGGICHKKILCLFPERILTEDGSLDRKKISLLLFQNPESLKKVNRVVHPAVREEIEKRIRQEKEKNRTGLMVVEAALLTQGGLDTLCDEIWAVGAKTQIRIRRLMESRGYTREKCLQIMSQQASWEEYRKGADHIIDNSGDRQMLMRQIDALVMNSHSHTTGLI